MWAAISATDSARRWHSRRISRYSRSRPAVSASVRADITGLDREYREILRLCQHRALSVAEIAAHMNLLLAAVKVLISDLIDSGYLIYQSPRPAAAQPDIKLLQAVLDGVRKL